MLIGAMAARRRAVRLAFASFSSQISMVGRRPCLRSPQCSIPANCTKGSTDVDPLGLRAPAARCFSSDAFPPPDAIEAPVSQLSYTNPKEVFDDTWMPAMHFMRGDDVFQNLNLNPLLQAKGQGTMPEFLVALGTLRPFVVSCLGLAYGNHRYGISVGISFREDNMEVSSKYKEVRLKKAVGYVFNPGKSVTAGRTYWDLSRTLDEMIRKVYPHIQYPLCFADLLRNMRNVCMDEAMEIYLIHHSSLLSSKDYINFIADTNILVRKRLPIYRGCDPEVKRLLNRLYYRLAKLVGYDKLPWLITITKHDFLLACYEYSEQLRNNPALRGEASLQYHLNRGMVARRLNGGLAVALKCPLAETYPIIRQLAINHMALQRDPLEHLLELLGLVKESFPFSLALQECFPFSREDVAEAIRAILPLTAVVIQDELFRAGLFNSEMRMTTYRSVSPYSIRCGISLHTDRVLTYKRPQKGNKKRRRQRKVKKKEVPVLSSKSPQSVKQKGGPQSPQSLQSVKKQGDSEPPEPPQSVVILQSQQSPHPGKKKRYSEPAEPPQSVVKDSPQFAEPIEPAARMKKGGRKGPKK